MNTLKAFILLAMSAFFAEKIVSGRLYYYIGPRFGWMAMLSVGLLMLPAVAYLWLRRGGHQHEHNQISVWTVLIIAVPLGLGIAIPPRPLGASSIANRGFANDAALSNDNLKSTLSVGSGQRNILDWARAIHANADPDALNGQSVEVIGFVYRDAQFADNQFMVARLTIVCCVADAAAIGLVVQSPEAKEFTPDSWLRVKGKFTAGALDNRPMPVVVAEEITPIEPPQQPYLYP